MDLLVLFAVALVAMAGLLLLIYGYRMAPASVLAPLDYTSMVWAVLLGYVIWNELPGPMVWTGTVLVVAAGLLIVQREARLPKHPAVSMRGPAEE